MKDEFLNLNNSRDLYEFSIDDVRFDNMGIRFTTNCIKSTVYLISIIYFSLWNILIMNTNLKNYVNVVNLRVQ